MSYMRINMRELSAKLGYSVSTVSRALRGIGRMRESTRNRVLAEAERMGYVRDPILSGALTFIRKRDKPTYREHFAFMGFTPFDERPDWLVGNFKGALAQASALGYSLEYVMTPQSAHEQEKLSGKLKNKGIRGIIVTPDTDRSLFSLDAMDWAHFKCIQIGSALTSPYVSRIIRDLSDQMPGVFERLYSLGYRRFALAIQRDDEARERWTQFSSALLFSRFHRDVRVFSLSEFGYPYTPEGLNKFIRKVSPDVVVVNGPIIPWIESGGWRIPGELGLFRMDCYDNSRESGLQADYETMGQISVKQLSMAIEHSYTREDREKQISIIAVPSFWHKGTTLLDVSGRKGLNLVRKPKKTAPI